MMEDEERSLKKEKYITNNVWLRKTKPTEKSPIHNCLVTTGTTTADGNSINTWERVLCCFEFGFFVDCWLEFCVEKWIQNCFIVYSIWRNIKYIYSQSFTYRWFCDFIEEREKNKTSFLRCYVSFTKKIKKKNIKYL